METIKALSDEAVDERAKETMEEVSKKLGRVPNMYRVMANAPAVLETYTKLNGALSSGSLGSRMAELIALAAAETNGCSYCLSAHTFLGAKAGLSEVQIMNGRRFFSAEEKEHAGLLFAKKIIDSPKEISPIDAELLKSAGYSGGDILEIVANVVRNLFTNYINIIAGTEVDWPTIVNPFNHTTNN